MDDLAEARRLMELVAGLASQAGPIDAVTIINMAKVWAHIDLAQTTREQTDVLRRIAELLEGQAR